ncbi:MAG: hypothetical protein ABL925_17810 [Methylococcales bacterium]
MKTKEEYIESFASELKDWSAQIDVLTAKTEKSAGMVKLKYVQELNSIRTKQHNAGEKMKELEEAGTDAWEAAKATADKVWDDLRSGLATTVSKFK